MKSRNRIVRDIVFLGITFAVVGWLMTRQMVQSNPPENQKQSPQSMVTVRFFKADGNPTDPQQVPAILKTDEEWSKLLFTDFKYALIKDS